MCPRPGVEAQDPQASAGKVRGGGRAEATKPGDDDIDDTADTG